MVEVKGYGTIRNGFVPSRRWVIRVCTDLINIHMVCRTYHHKSLLSQNCFDSFIEPVACGKPPNEDNMLKPERSVGTLAVEQSGQTDICADSVWFRTASTTHLMEDWKNFATSDLQDKARLARSASKHDKNGVPSKLQLTKSNTTSGVTVFCGSKFDILRICFVAKPWFRVLVKTVGNMVEVVHKSRFC